MNQRNVLKWYHEFKEAEKFIILVSCKKFIAPLWDWKGKDHFDQIFASWETSNAAQYCVTLQILNKHVQFY